MKLLRVLTIAATALFTSTIAVGPKVSKTEFDRPPGYLFYFEDSPVILSIFTDSRHGEVWRSDNNGATWSQVKEPGADAIDIQEHPHDPKRAIILGVGTTHWATKDRGESWQKIEVEFPVSSAQASLSFHAENPDYVLYAGRNCEDEGFFELCEDNTYYTTNWFKDIKLLKKLTRTCLFARSTKLMKGGEEDTVLCVLDDATKFHQNRILEISDNFKDWDAPKLDGINHLKGVNGLAAVQKFMVAALRSEGTDEMALYVTDNIKDWTRAEFPHDHGGLKEGGYTILESTPYSIQVDVKSTPSNIAHEYGALFTSNSNGTYFTRNVEHTNRIQEGLVDFEKIEGIEGIVMVNVVKNWDDRNSRQKKKLVSRISFDDGKADTWKPLKAGSKDLHLYSVTGFQNLGRVFSSKAPGLLMGVGNTGDYLDDYNDCDLYVSDDAGLTWEKALSEAHIYEFGGAGSILVAVYNEGPTKEAKYSINYGKDWEKVDLGIKINARILTTTPDSTGLNFVIVGTDSDKKAHVIALDLSGVLERKCELDKEHPDKSDFEKWYARYDEDKKPDCLMGHKEFYWRRRKDAKCNAGNLYNEPEVEEEVCECQDHDFECDFNFVKDREGKCVLAPGAKLSIPPDQCKKPGDKYKGPSGYRKIPGNTCKDGIAKDVEIERDCKDANSAPPALGVVKAKLESFKGKAPVYYFYLDNAESAAQPDETIFMRTENQEVWISHDGGFKWEQPKDLEDIKVLDIYNNPHNYAHVYIITGSTDFYVTKDRGKTFTKHEAPTPPNKEGHPVLDFHPKESDWVIWVGQEPHCKGKCKSVAYWTRDVSFEEKGWESLLANTGKCQWMQPKGRSEEGTLIFCSRLVEKFDPHSVNVELVSSGDYFKTTPKVHFSNIIGYAKMEEFIVVASINETDASLAAYTSIDGDKFARAHFPVNLNVPHQTAYTVLDSITHAVFLHVTTNDVENLQFGSLLKSNSNGTNYVQALDGINRNGLGYVDFEKVHSLEGVIVVNRVVNKDEVITKSAPKKLRTMVSHNDGSHWSYIKPPPKDSGNKPYKCSGGIEECSLNLHHYTERNDPRHTFGSASGVGLMFGVGNVGSELKKDGDTFMSTDGGFTWKEIKKGRYLWEYGDQGSIIVIVDITKPTNKVYYTLDEGDNWVEYKFGDELEVFDISTVASDTSRRFVIWGREQGSQEKFYSVHLDFSGITDQQCVFDDGDNDDFELWIPNHDGEQCLFGHVAQYNRKIPSHRCYVGRKIPTFHRVLQNCTCTKADYECDFNYERGTDNACYLIKGLEPPNHEQMCSENPELVEWYPPTGYRRLPITTCEGGRELDKGEAKPCRGKEDQFKKKHSKIGGFGLFMAIAFPIGAAAAAGWYVWTKVLNRQVGAIRLGEERESNLLQYPIIALAAIVAVAAAIPQILGAVGRWLGTKFTRQRRYTTRSSFARGGDYSIVNNDEGELLGDDDDDDF